MYINVINGGKKLMQRDIKSQERTLRVYIYLSKRKKSYKRMY